MMLLTVGGGGTKWRQDARKDEIRDGCSAGRRRVSGSSVDFHPSATTGRITRGATSCQISRAVAGEFSAMGLKTMLYVFFVTTRRNEITVIGGGREFH